MQSAIEFMTKKKGARTIEIPEEYAGDISGEFRVILILNKEPQKKTARKRVFNAFEVKTKGFKFNRDEIYTPMHNDPTQ